MTNATAATTNIAAADLLDLAADNLEIRGWCRGAMLTPDGHVCAVGAIDHAYRVNTTTRDTATTALAEVLATDYGYPLGADGLCNNKEAIFHINDHLAESGQEIATCMRRAAARLREQP